MWSVFYSLGRNYMQQVKRSMSVLDVANDFYLPVESQPWLEYLLLLSKET